MTVSSVPFCEVPAALGINADKRRLGAMLRQITLRSAEVRLAIAHSEPSLVDGFHDREAGHRWTNGDALVPPRFLRCLGGAVEIEIDAGRLPHYPVFTHPQRELTG